MQLRKRQYYEKSLCCGPNKVISLERYFLSPMQGDHIRVCRIYKFPEASHGL